MSLEVGESDGVRNGYILAHTDATPDAEGTYTQERFRVLYEAPDMTQADSFMTSGLIKFFEQATNGTIKMVMIFAKGLLNHE